MDEKPGKPSIRTNALARLAVILLCVVSGASAGAVMLAPIVRNPQDSIEASQYGCASLGGFIGLTLAVLVICACDIAVQFQVQFGLRSLFGAIAAVAGLIALCRLGGPDFTALTILVGGGLLVGTAVVYMLLGSR